MYIKKKHIIDDRENRQNPSQINYRPSPPQLQNCNSHPQTRKQNKISSSPPTTGITNVGTVPHFANNNGRQHLASKNSINTITDKKVDKKKKKDKKLLKEDIGNPTNFK